MNRKTRRRLELRHLKRLPTAGVLLIVLVMTVLIGVVWIWASPTIVDAVSLSETEWSNVAALTSAAALAVALGAGVILLIELAETADSRNLEIYRDIYQKFMSDEQIRARRFIYQELPDPDEPQVVINAVLGSDEARKEVKKVLNLIDYFGFLVQQDWVTSDEVIGWLSPVVVKVWAKIGPVVSYERRQRPEEPDYYEAAMNLADKCRAWRQNNFPEADEEISFLDDRL